MLQKGVQSLCLCGIPCRIVTMFLAVPDSPADFGRVGFRPPAIQLGKIQATIDEDLHSTRSAGLQGRRGILVHRSTPCTNSWARSMS